MNAPTTTDPVDDALAYLESLPQRQDRCPLEPDLMDLAAELETTGQSMLFARFGDHVPTCPYCSRAVAGYRARMRKVATRVGLDGEDAA